MKKIYIITSTTIISTIAIFTGIKINNNNYIDNIKYFMDKNNLKCENSKLILLGNDDDDVRGYTIKDYNKN